MEYTVQESDEPGFDPAFMSKANFDEVCFWAFRNGYSDIIISTENPLIYRRHRLNWRSTRGSLSENAVRNLGNAICSDAVMVKVTASQPMDISYETTKNPITEDSIRFRVNVIGVSHHLAKDGFRITLRIIPGKPWLLAENGLEPHLAKSLFPQDGLVFVGGPMGSGKTTLCSSVIRYLSENTQDNIICYEDPVEFDQSLCENANFPAGQVEIHKHVTWADATRNLLRQAIDTAYWGESRDPESIRSLCTAVDLGMRVYSTGHSNSTASLLPRLIGEFTHDERDNIKGKLINSCRVLLYQRLLPAKSGGVVPLRDYIVLTDDIRDLLRRTDLPELEVTVREQQRLAMTDPLTVLDRLLIQEHINQEVYDEWQPVFGSK